MSADIAPQATAATPVAPASSADRFMRRLLRLPEGKTATAEEARSAFQKSIFISAARCVLMYVFFPFVLPLIGVAKGVGPVIGLVINLAAMVCIVMSMRRFFRADHPKRWWYATIGGTVFALLVYVAVVDVVDLLT